MVVAFYLTTVTVPRLYGVQVMRILEAESLYTDVAKADVLITDTLFDVNKVSVKYCCVLKGTPDVELFAKKQGLDCIAVNQLVSWFEKRVNIDVSRQARQTVQRNVERQINLNARINTEDYKALYAGLANELSKLGMYPNLSIADAKTYDLLLQTIRGTVHKVDGISTELAEVKKKLVQDEALIEQLTKQKEIVDDDVEVVLSGLSHVVEDCELLLNKLITVDDAASLIELTPVKVKARAALGLLSKLNSVVKAGELRAVGSVLREFLACETSITEDLYETVSSAVNESTEAKKQLNEIALERTAMSSQISRVRNELEQAKQLNENKVKTLQNQLAQEKQVNKGLQGQMNELNTLYQKQLQKNTEYETQKLLGNENNVSALQEQLRILKIELQTKNDQIKCMEDAMSETFDSTQKELLTPEVATGIIRQLRVQVANLKVERDRATAEMLQVRKAATKEAERAAMLENSARSLSQVALSGAQVSALPLFKYTGKGFIVPVIGNGSVGITSSALSLARILGVNAKTVLMDFDLMTTDLEGRFNERINPLITIEGEELSGKNSAMGLFISKGKDYFMSHYMELAVRVESNKAGILDYLPGFYSKPDLFMLTQADYTDLLNFLGSRYDYIIVDAGKIGCSEIGDQIIRNMCLCSFRNLFVTDATLEKTRAMHLKLNDVFGKDLRNVAERSIWMANRALKTIDLTRCTSPATTVLVPVLPEMVGVHASFQISGATKKAFNIVVKALAGV